MTHTPDNLDRILSAEQPLQPSSGFAASVMEQIRHEATAPAPIPFPWRRFLPVFLLAGVVLAGCLILLVRMFIEMLPELIAAPTPIEMPAMTPALTALCWSVGMLLMSLLCWRLAVRLSSSH